MSTTASDLNQRLIGFTDVQSLLLTTTYSGAYSLELILTKNTGKRIKLECDDVSELHLDKFGGGFNQFMVLRVQDISDRQLDRVSFQFEDLEDNKVGFLCWDARIAEIKP